MSRRRSAAPYGLRRPVSHLISVVVETFKSRAKTAWLVPSRFRSLRISLGGRAVTFLGTGTKERMEQLYGLLRQAPSNATKRYRGLSLKQAVEVADKKGDKKRLSGKSLDNYRVNIEAIFNFAVEEGFITKNPAKGRTLRALMDGGEPPKPKVHFTVEEMNRLVRSVPFELSRTQQGDRLKPAKMPLQSGRAWASLLSLAQKTVDLPRG
jgi:hypothetical protein